MKNNTSGPGRTKLRKGKGKRRKKKQSSTRCVLVHGVGYVEPKQNLRAAQSLAGRYWPKAIIDEYCWCDLVDSPLSFGELDIEYLHDLGKGIRTAAWLGHDSKQQRSMLSKLLVNIANGAATLYTISTLVLAVLGILSLLLYFAVILTPIGDPVWGMTGKGPPDITSLALQTIVGPVSCAPVLFRAGWMVLLGSISLAGVALICSTLARGREGLIEEVRRIVLSAIWPMVCCGAAMAIYPIKGVLIFFVIVILPIFGNISKLFAFEFDDWSSIWPAFGIAGLFLLLLIGVHFISAKFAYQLKLLADVFLYLGNAEYRKRILKGLKDCLDHNTSETKHLVVVAHSLGSVISADQLQQGCKAEKVSLVTMGSPLARLFRRFFPSQVQSLTERAGYLDNKYREFRWINVFRPLDFVGARLGADHVRFSEQPTGQLKDPFSSHIGYWDDKIVAETIQEEFERVPDTNAKHSNELPVDTDSAEVGRKNKAISPLNPAVLYPHRPKHSQHAALTCAFLLILILPAWKILTDYVIEPAQERRIIAQRHDYLEQHGKNSKAIVRASKKVEKDRSGGSTAYYPNYIVNLIWKHDGMTYEKKFTSHLLIDMKKLSERFGNGVKVVDNYYMELTNYPQFEAQILFDPEDSSRFALPEFRADKRVEDGLAPIMKFLSPIMFQIMIVVVVWLLFLPLIEAATGVSSVPILTNVRDEIVFSL